MSIVKIKHELCKKDSLCIAECPNMLLSYDQQSGYPKMDETRLSDCIDCGHCVAVCPTSALSLSSSVHENIVEIKDNLKISLNQVEQLLKSRRSIRNYLNKPVEKEKLEKLIDIARYAPTGMNSQMVQYVVVSTPEKVKEVAAGVIEFMRAVIKFDAESAGRYNLSKLVEIWDSGCDIILRGAPALIVAHTPKEYGLATIDCTLALSTLDIASQPLGLGCCWAGFFMIAISKSPDLMKLLGIPDTNICGGGLMVGYPKHKFRNIPGRKTAVVNWI